MSRTLETVSVALWIVIVIAALTGCGNPYSTAPVRGKLTLDGKPAEGAQVVFSPVDAPDKTGRPANEPGKPSRGKVGADGSFTLAQDDGQPGAVCGPHTVMFEPPLTKRPGIPGSERELMTPEEIKAAEAQIAAMPIYPALPPGLKITPAKVEVKPGDNTFEFALEK